MSKVVLSILVNNTSGVLMRVVGLFARRGYNIDSVSSGVTEDNRYSRITVAVTGDDIILDQIKKQVSKLEDVKSVKELADDHSVYRELCLVKVRATREDLQTINAIADKKYKKKPQDAEVIRGRVYTPPKEEKPAKEKKKKANEPPENDFLSGLADKKGRKHRKPDNSK